MKEGGIVVCDIALKKGDDPETKNYCIDIFQARQLL